MTAGPWLHRVQCALFVVATGTAYLVAASPPGTRGARYIGLYLVLTALMGGVWMTSRSAPAAEQRWTLAAGLLARVLLVAVPAFTSSDVVRYLWDGRAALAGIDPYRVVPNTAAPVLPAAWPMPLVHTNLPTIYPPGAIALFALCASFGSVWSPWLWKALVLSASIVTVVVTDRALGAARVRRHLPLVALSPLLILEGGVGAHLDVIAALSIAGAIILAQRKRAALTGVALGLGALVKFLPAVAAVPLAVALGRRDGARLVAGAAAVCAVGYAAAFLVGFHPLGSLLVFFRASRFGSPLAAAHAAMGESNITLMLSIAVAAISIGIIGLRSRHGRWPIHVQYALAIPLVLSPVVFPWYLSPLVPALALAPSAFAIAWMTVLPFSYEVIDRLDSLGVWQPAPWLPWIVGAAWSLGVAIDLVLCFSGSRPAAPAARTERLVRSRQPVTERLGGNFHPRSVVEGFIDERT